MILFQRNIRDKSQISHSASTIFTSKKRKTRINVAKSANLDKKNFRNYVTSCVVCKHKEDYGKMNHEQYQILKTPKRNTTVPNTERSLTTSRVHNRDELFVLKHALSLDHSLYSNINHKSNSRNYTFLREKKLSKLKYSQFNHLINQILH